jgi:8-oxo-dGTP pyrophosphatase MutT (NUDIX family)
MERKRYSRYPCKNCNFPGHLSKNCYHPKNSYGIILYRKDDDCYRYLVIQKKNTFGYFDLIKASFIDDINYYRNIKNNNSKYNKQSIHNYQDKYQDKYSNHNYSDSNDYIDTNKHNNYSDSNDSNDLNRYIEINKQNGSDDSIELYDNSALNNHDKSTNISESTPKNITLKEHELAKLKNIIKYMPYTERNNIINHSFDALWDTLWSWQIKVDMMFDLYLTYKCIFNTYRNIYITLMIQYPCRTIEPFWEFPKGKRNSYESDIECAKREFFEETTYNDNDYNINNEYISYEKYIGTNNIEYNIKYYLAELTNLEKSVYYNPDNIEQNNEIRKIAWFNYQECSDIIIKRKKDQYIYDTLLKIEQKLNC